MLMTNLVNLFTNIHNRKQEKMRFKRDTRLNKVISIANEYSAYTPESIQNKITHVETLLVKAPFWKRKQMLLLTEALYRAQNLINNRAKIHQRHRTIARAPLYVIKGSKAKAA